MKSIIEVEYDASRVDIEDIQEAILELGGVESAEEIEMEEE